MAVSAFQFFQKCQHFRKLLETSRDIGRYRTTATERPLLVVGGNANAVVDVVDIPAVLEALRSASSNGFGESLADAEHPRAFLMRDQYRSWQSVRAARRVGFIDRWGRLRFVLLRVRTGIHSQNRSSLSSLSTSEETQ